MGADLYIDSIHTKAREEWQPKFDAAVRWRDSMPKTDPQSVAAQLAVDEAYRAMYSEAGGYFRDSYNATSVLNMMSLSWWQDVKTIGGFLDINAIKKLRGMVLERDIPVAAVVEQRLSGRNAVIDDDDNTPDKWRQSFVEHREELLRFLNRALELSEPVRASL